jgi:hypothetical protein
MKKELNDERSDARDDDSSNAVDSQNTLFKLKALAGRHKIYICGNFKYTPSGD